MLQCQPGPGKSNLHMSLNILNFKPLKMMQKRFFFLSPCHVMSTAGMWPAGTNPWETPMPPPAPRPRSGRSAVSTTAKLRLGLVFTHTIYQAVLFISAYPSWD